MTDTQQTQHFDKFTAKMAENTTKQGNEANLLLEAVPIEIQKYLAETYKKVSFGRKPTKISQYGGSIFVSFSKNETYRFNIGLYKSEVKLD